MGQVEWARDLARQLLEEPLPRRWAHTQGVACQAETLRPLLADDAEILVSAAWLHDIGYSPSLVQTGFHALDGARYLRATRMVDERVVRLVAYHSCAQIEASERHLDQELASEFAPEDDELTEALIFCDMTTAPDGSKITVQQRLAEIQERYGEDHIVGRAISKASPAILSAVQKYEGVPTQRFGHIARS